MSENDGGSFRRKLSSYQSRQKREKKLKILYRTLLLTIASSVGHLKGGCFKVLHLFAKKKTKKKDFFTIKFTYQPPSLPPKWRNLTLDTPVWRHLRWWWGPWRSDCARWRRFRWSQHPAARPSWELVKRRWRQRCSKSLQHGTAANKWDGGWEVVEW